MNENRRQILEMLAAGKITADEADRLIAAFEPEPAAASAGVFTGNIAGSKFGPDTPVKTSAKYLRVLVESTEKGGPTTVNVRVPMQLLRAGVRLVSLIPVQARDHVNGALRENGVPFDLSQIKPENLEEIVDQLDELTVDVNRKSEKAKVRVFCE